MPTFNSVAELKSYIIKRMQPAVRNVQEKVHQIMFNWLNAFYGEYDPSVYIRTFQVLDSLVKTNVVSTGNGYEGEVYFDLNALSHPRQYIGQDGRTVYANWDEGTILNSVMTGSTHGGVVGGTAVWTEAMSVITPECIQWLKQELIAAGIPIS